MKKLLVLSALVGAFAFSSCASCDETQASQDLGTASTAYSNAFGTMDCAAINTAWDNYTTAFNNLCDSQKGSTDWAAVEAAHNIAIEALGC